LYRHIERIKSKSQSEACNELKRLKTKIMAIGDKKDSEKYPDKKAVKASEKYPPTLLLYITGHCNDAGNLILPDGSSLKKKDLSEFINNINPKNLIVLANGYYSEKLVKNLSQVQKNNLFTSSPRTFFGVFSHAGNMCAMSRSDISDENSIFVRFILDILKKDEAEVSSSSNEVSEGYLTAAGLVAEINKRMVLFSKCLKPIDRCGGSIPIAYI
jgi:hypothetical protein